MSRIFWDTNLFLYLIEESEEWSAQVIRIRERMLARGDELFTSTLTLGEVLVHPLERDARELAAEYELAITSAAVVIPFDKPVARRFAAIRKDRSIRAPDAIQLACAAQVSTDLFITNDDRLKGKDVPGVQFITRLGQELL